jgi:curli production assembly/transport component CsgG
MEAALALLLVLGFLNESATPVWSDKPEECKEITFDDPYIGPNTVSRLEKTLRHSYICVEEAEAIRLPSYIELLDLPPAKDRPVVAVYGFKDLTGQRKSREGIADFSTAVSQGGTELLIDALKTAGDGSWFRVVERQGIDNLVRERQIIRSARNDFAGPEGAKALNPLLFAGMIMEGGIIGYDTNVQTGGRGARLLGIGKSKRYQQDVVTVSVRAVSVLTGEVLLNVQAKKTILSYGGSGDIFRFVDNSTTLVEYEDGVGNNESVTYATRTAIEAAVLELIYQGHDRGLWVIEDGHRHPHQVGGKNDKHPIKEENNENE